MAAIQITCPHCQTELLADPQTAGQAVRCKHCHGYLRISGKPASSGRLLAVLILLAIPLGLGGVGAAWYLNQPSVNDAPIAVAPPASVTTDGPVSEKDEGIAMMTPSPSPLPAPPPVAVVQPVALKSEPAAPKAKENPPPEPSPTTVPEKPKPPVPAVVATNGPPRTPPKVKPNGKAPLPIPPLTEEERRLQYAIQRGLQYLVSTQDATGTWNKAGHPVGYAAMPGLALLEGGVPASHPAVQKAAFFVRAKAPALDGTYELALAILFLDRLGDARDVPMIRALALRLIAGQTDQGGWSYRCPLLTPQDETQLVSFLLKNQPRPDPLQPPAHPFLIPLPKDKFTQLDPLLAKKDLFFDPLDPKKKDPFFDPLLIFKDPAFANPLPKEPGNTPAPQDAKKPDSNLTIPFDAPDPKKPVRPMPQPEPKDAKDPAVKPQPPKVRPNPAFNPPASAQENPPAPQDIRKWPRVPDFVAKDLGRVPIIPGKGFGKGFGRFSGGDNSNTQFAILGLWAARRHGVPMTLTLNLLDERFRGGQTVSGAWNYHNSGGAAGGTAPMTCVGLLGLGVSLGAYREAMLGKNAPAPMVDPAIQKGLQALSKWIGDPAQARNLYGLWSVERTVAVMYHLPTIGGKDWHAWGSQMLLSAQKDKGNWHVGGYPGNSDVLDTSMAILFLRRTNLSQDLTDNLRRFIVIPDQ